MTRHTLPHTHQPTPLQAVLENFQKARDLGRELDERGRAAWVDILVCAAAHEAARTLTVGRCQ